MAKGSDSVIKKIAVTALQRFKNQNLILKEFGENGLRAYKEMDNKGTWEEIREKLGIDEKDFSKIVKFMEKNGMIEIKETHIEKKAFEEKEVEAPEIEEEVEPVEDTTEEVEEEPSEEVEEIEPIEKEPDEEVEPVVEKEESEEEEVEPIEKESEEEKEVEAPEIEEVEPVEDTTEEVEEEPSEEVEEIEPVDEEDDYGIESKSEKKTEESSMEKIIRDKYGEIGITVYGLIDGEKSAEEIMKETGLTEKRLIEILDYMEEKGIIKLEYPDKKGSVSQTETKSLPATDLENPFKPMIDHEIVPKNITGMQTIDVPVKLPLDIVKSVQLKAKIMFEFGEKGSAVFEAIDGKRDMVEIVLHSKSSLKFVMKIINFLLNNNAILLKPIDRDKIQEKYGVEAYRIYKKFGREGVLLYELIGKDMDIKQMMSKITEDSELFIEMFVFVHNVLGVPIPIERDILKKRLQ
ncbi:MAG: hypothetical protein PHU63_01980 [Candidatus ainarchaeum sp.]|nr:hypothetical protein [Candidatus ainarchaeum sp.]